MKKRTKFGLVSLAFFAAGVLVATVAFAGTAFLKGEYVDGLNKICLYDYLGSTVAITVKAYELCPLTIETG